jgi:hypothetical protein
MIKRNSIVTTTVAAFLTAATLTISSPLQAGNTGAFIGGIFASKVMSNMNQRTEAEQAQAYNSQQPVRQAAPAQASAQSPEQRIQQLDKLAAGGYITPAEYKAKKQSIIDSM